MALATYSDLQTAIAGHLHRSDLTSVIPDLIVLAENRIYGDLNSRQQDTVTNLSTVASQEYVALPSDFINARTVVCPAVDEVLDYKAPDQFAKIFISGATGYPTAYTIVGSNLYLSPVPDSAYTLRMVYQQKVPAIASGTNWLMTNFPAVYLYASLCAAAPYLKDDNRLPVWEQIYKESIQAVNSQDWSSMANMTVRGDVTL